MPFPKMISCNPVKMYRWGVLELFLLEGIVAESKIEMPYMLTVYENGKALKYISAERDVLVPDKIYLGIFEENIHKNLGLSDDCKDLMSFGAMALEMVGDEFNYSMLDLEEVPVPAK